jgi:hypothetical protein
MNAHRRVSDEEFINLKTLQNWLLLLVALFAVTACTDEAPTEVGDDLLPGDEVRTFEVILEPSAFSVYDTTFSGFADVRNAPFTIIANDFEGVLDVHSLIRFTQPPTIISVRNAAGNVVVDSTPSYFAGRLVLRVDTTASESTPPVLLRAFQTAEEWGSSATWTLRLDTRNVQLPWATPGGTRGAEIDTATWAVGDSIVLRVDSQTIAQWIDTTNAARGALIVTETSGARIRINSAVLRLSAHSDLDPDTVVTFDASALTSGFIFDPPPPAPGTQLRVGGVPTWRTIIGLREDLATLTFPCPEQANCEVRLESAHINRAELLLQPVTAPAGYIPEDTTLIQVRTLLVTPGVPLQRSPIGIDICGGGILCLVSGRVAPDYFGATPRAEPVALDVTNYIIALVDEDIEDVNRPPFALTLLVPAEPSTLGFAAFAPGVRLRLVLTAPVERTQ